MFNNKFQIRHSIYSSAVILVICILIAILFVPNFFASFDLLLMVKQVAYITLMSYGATIIIMLGHLNVAYGSVMALVGCIAVKLMLATNSFLVTIPVTLLLGGCIGAVIGLIVTRIDIPSFIVTLIIGRIARGTAMVYTKSAPILQIGKLEILGKGELFGIPFSFFIIVVCFFFAWVIVNKTSFGRQVLAVGENRSAASAAGIRVRDVIMKSYIIDGIFIAIAAIVFMARMNSGLPDAGESSEFDVMTAVVIGGASLTGGRGNITGTIIGAITVGLINYVLNIQGVNYNWQNIIKGLLVLIVLAVEYILKRKDNTN